MKQPKRRGTRTAGLRQHSDLAAVVRDPAAVQEGLCAFWGSGFGVEHKPPLAPMTAYLKKWARSFLGELCRPFSEREILRRAERAEPTGVGPDGIPYATYICCSWMKTTICRCISIRPQWGRFQR